MTSGIGEPMLAADNNFQQDQSTVAPAVALLAATIPLSTSADAAWRGGRGGWHGGGWHGGGWGWGGLGIGLAAGALTGGALAAPYYGGCYGVGALVLGGGTVIGGTGTAGNSLEHDAEKWLAVFGSDHAHFTLATRVLRHSMFAV